MAGVSLKTSAPSQVRSLHELEPLSLQVVLQAQYVTLVAEVDSALEFRPSKPSSHWSRMSRHMYEVLNGYLVFG